MSKARSSVSLWSAVSAVFLLSFSFTANADGFYAGGSVGGATFEADFDQGAFPELPASVDEDDTAYKLFVGYKVDLPVLTLGVEGGYVNFGEPEIPVTGIPGLTEFGIETTALNLWGTAGIEVGPVDLYAKLGYISWDAELSVDGFGSASEDGTDAAYGVGLSFGLGPLEVRGEYEMFEFDDTDLSMVSVGVAFYF